MTNTDQKQPSKKLGSHHDDCVHPHLEQAIEDYLKWMKSVGYTRQTRQSHQRQLNQFLCFSKNQASSWKKLFTLEHLEEFKNITGQSALSAINALSRYLFSQGKIPKPLARKTKLVVLPTIYEDYLVPVQKSGKMGLPGIKKIKFRWQQLWIDNCCQLANEYLLITSIFGRTSPAFGEIVNEKLCFYAACLRASVSKLADTIEAQT